MPCHRCFAVLFLESVHNNIVQKIRPHIGGQVLHPIHLRNSSERFTHNKRLHKVNLVLCVTRSEDFLKCVICKTWPPICGLFEQSYYERTLVALIIDCDRPAPRIVYSDILKFFVMDPKLTLSLFRNTIMIFTLLMR